MREIIKEQRLIAFCILFAILYNFPIISLFNKFSKISNIPVLYIYLFVVWFVIIAVIFAIVSNNKGTELETIDEMTHE